MAAAEDDYGVRVGETVTYSGEKFTYKGNDIFIKNADGSQYEYFAGNMYPAEKEIGLEDVDVKGKYIAGIILLLLIAGGAAYQTYSTAKGG